jgi:hypothetical protein
MRNLRSNGLGLAFLVAISSCGSGGGSSSGGGGDGTSAGIALAEFPSEYMDAYCSYLARCAFMPDKATCEATLVLDLPQLVAGVKAEKIKYDAKAAAACLAAIKSMACTKGFPSPTCKDAMKPLVINGGACFVDDECITGYCDKGTCGSSAKCCPGTCRPAEDCSYTGCPDGQFCVSTDPYKRTCQAKAGLGQPCTYSETEESSCVAGATCTWSESGDATCVKIPAEGQKCETDTLFMDCSSSLDYCDEVTLKCTRKVPVGGSCSKYNCVAYAECDSTGTCVALPGPGEECKSDDWCLGSLYCYSGTCDFPPPSPICE